MSRFAWRSLFFPAVLVVIGSVAYASGVHAPFILDDKLHILRDATIKPPVSLWRLLGNDRPIVTMSLALNYAIGHLDVFSYHLLNVGAHIICALLVYGWARFTLQLPAVRAHRGAAVTGLAFVAAAVFLVHPIQTESVTYIIQRAEIFAAVALVGGLWIAGVAAQRARAAEEQSVADAMPSQAQVWRRWLPPLALVSVFGLFSKESVVVLPVLFALYDWCFIAAGRFRAMRRHWPVYAVLVVLAVGAGGIRWWQATHQAAPLGGVALGAAAAPAGAEAATGVAVPLTPWRYLTWQFGVLLYYLRLVVLPNRLCFDCGDRAPWPVRSSPLGDAVWLPAGLLIAIAVAAWRARRSYPLLTFAVFGSAIALAPTSSILPLTDVYVEHRLYVPIAFLALLSVTAVFDAGAAVARRGGVSSRTLRIAAVLTAGTVITILGSLTIARNRLYAEPLRLWEDSVAIAPHSERALFNLGNEYARDGQRAKAIQCYQELVRIDPGPTYYVNLAQEFLLLNRNQEALQALEQARALAPTWGIIQRKLLLAYTRLGRLPEAVAAAQQGTVLEPLYPYGYQVLGDAYRRVGRMEEARQAYQKARTLESWERHGPPSGVAPP